MLRLGLLVLAVSLLGCSDAKAVNAAFSQTRVSWFLFDPEEEDGLLPLAGFEQGQRVEWKPRNHAVFATDLLAVSPSQGAIAVSGLGMLLVDDSGDPTATRPLAQVPLEPYRTDRLFLWKDKLFVSLYQEPPFASPPASLAWWAPGQSRLAFYPVPSQVSDPTRQAVEIVPPLEGEVLGLLWKRPTEAGWRYELGTLDLGDGAEGTASFALPDPEPLPEDFALVRARLSDRLGADVTSYPVRAPGAILLFTETGWVAVARPGDSQSRLYRLPDLGLAGCYTKAIALQRGVLFSWEFSFRGYTGAAGVVHVPFGVLAP